MLTFKNTITKKKLLYFMGKIQFSESTIKVGSQLNHIWANVLGNECKYGVTETHWLDFHKPIYIAFKLPNTCPMYNKNPLMSSFI
jgi:hypothetical protein